MDTLLEEMAEALEKGMKFALSVMTGDYYNDRAQEVLDIMGGVLSCYRQKDYKIVDWHYIEWLERS